MIAQGVTPVANGTIYRPNALEKLKLIDFTGTGSTLDVSIQQLYETLSDGDTFIGYMVHGGNPWFVTGHRVNSANGECMVLGDSGARTWRGYIKKNNSWTYQ